MQIEREIITIKRIDNTGLLKEDTTTEHLFIIADSGKALKRKSTGELIEGVVGLGTDDSLDNYEEVENGDN